MPGTARFRLRPETAGVEESEKNCAVSSRISTSSRAIARISGEMSTPPDAAAVVEQELVFPEIEFAAESGRKCRHLLPPALTGIRGTFVRQNDPARFVEIADPEDIGVVTEFSVSHGFSSLLPCGSFALTEKKAFRAGRAPGRLCGGITFRSRSRSRSHPLRNRIRIRSRRPHRRRRSGRRSGRARLPA